MNKTTVIILAVIAVYIVVIFPKQVEKSNKNTETATPEADTESGTGLEENADENGVSQGAAGQQKYRIGYVK